MTDPAAPILTVTNGVAHLAFATDDYSLDFAELGMSKYGSLFSEVTARHGGQILHMARFDLLNQREQEHFHQRCLAVNGSVADWQSRLQSAIPGLKQLLPTAATSRDSCWAHVITVADFLAQPDEDLAADVRNLLVPGCSTIIAAPRASCKTIVAHAMGLALAQGGLFRGERVPQRRVLLVDRDNAPALIRKRMRWLGGHGVTTFKLLTRDKAPPLTDAAAWGALPVEDYDVVIIDSIGAATEGVSEKEGKLTQLYLATLKDLAYRGPAILALDNTNKAGQNYRGRGEKGDAVDIVYEARNITGWTPPHGGDWWEDLPDFGEHTWQERASRRKGQQVLRIAFVPSKFRLGMDPEPFCLEIDTRQEPWTLSDCTEALATAGARAAEEHTHQERQKLEQASRVLVGALQKQHPTPLLKMEAEALLQGQGLLRKVARTLLERGGNRDVYPEGAWVLRAITSARGTPVGVTLAGEEILGGNKDDVKSPCENATSEKLISADGSTPHSGNTGYRKTSKSALERDAVFPPQPEYSTAEIDHADWQQRCASHEVGFISAEFSHSNDAGLTCALCGGTARWQDGTVKRCVTCWPPPKEGA